MNQSGKLAFVAPYGLAGHDAKAAAADIILIKRTSAQIHALLLLFKLLNTFNAHLPPLFWTSDRM
jgi:hypothetical protein